VSVGGCEDTNENVFPSVITASPKLDCAAMTLFLFSSLCYSGGETDRGVVNAGESDFCKEKGIKTKANEEEGGKSPSRN
jgi:putative hemolysin